MFDFCFKDKDKPLDFNFSLHSLDSYNCFLKGMNAKTWWGRSIYFITAITGFAPYILSISGLFDGCLKSQEKETNNDELEAAFFDREFKPAEEEIFDVQLEKEETVKLDKKNAEAASDDEALALQLQDEEYGGAGLAKEFSALKNDEQIAREMQEKLDVEQIKKDLSKEDEAFARKMQSELNDGKASTSKRSREQSVGKTKATSPSDSILSLKDKEVFEEGQAALKVEDATYQILNTPGWEVQEELEDEGDPTSKKMITHDLLSSKFRAIVAALTRENPQVISLVALKAQREVNIDQYLALKLKQFSHVEEIQGTVMLPSGKLFKLEGFFDVLAAPMLIAAYEAFPDIAHFFKEKDKDWIFSQLNQIIFADYISKKEVESLVEDLQSTDFVGPVILSTGFIGHCAAVGWFGDYMLYLDRGCINAEPGIHVFHIPNRELITENFIREIVEREEIKEKDYRMIENILSQLNAKLVHYERMEAQKVGSCAKATMDACLELLMTNRILLNNHRKISLMKDLAWKRAFEQSRPICEKFNAYESKLVFDDMMSEIEEWLTHKTSFGKHNLKKMYQDVLTFWLYAPHAKREKSAFKRVQNLLDALERDSSHP